ncbi:hypothetical protein QJS04_geneDACA019552 [Acorus gramineus]|uniref:Uncharacterized protein n=1 Tax=Acorus gramineus TaxID=55184 RepID=A0AAV9AEH8_ACOGR|nr:hypothetical protein QJS04_geneDACA019552 [Acorus gramineus]
MPFTEIVTPFLPTFPSKRSPPSPKKIALLADAFERNLLRHIENLISAAIGGDPPPSTPIGLSCLSNAVDVLSSIHAEAGVLFSGPSVSGTESILASYLDESVKLLDFCNSVSAEIESLSRRRLLIRFAVHVLSSSSGTGEEKLRRARDSISDWEKENSTPSAAPVDLAPAPRGKISGHGAIYAVGAVSAIVAGSLSAALNGGSSEGCGGVSVSGEFPWADALHRLESAMSGEKERSIGEFVHVDIAVRALAEVLDKGVETETETETEGLSNAVNEVKRAMDELSNGLERLTNAVNGLFRAVLGSRNLALQKFRLCPRKCK